MFPPGFHHRFLILVVVVVVVVIVVVVAVAYTYRGIKSRAAGELFIIIRGDRLSLGSHEHKGSWGEPHESVFADHFHKETI